MRFADRWPRVDPVFDTSPWDYPLADGGLWRSEDKGIAPVESSKTHQAKFHTAVQEPGTSSNEGTGPSAVRGGGGRGGRKWKPCVTQVGDAVVLDGLKKNYILNTSLKTNANTLVCDSPGKPGREMQNDHLAINFSAPANNVNAVLTDLGPVETNQEGNVLWDAEFGPKLDYRISETQIADGGEQSFMKQLCPQKVKKWYRYELSVTGDGGGGEKSGINERVQFAVNLVAPKDTCPPPPSVYVGVGDAEIGGKGASVDGKGDDTEELDALEGARLLGTGSDEETKRFAKEEADRDAAEDADEDAEDDVYDAESDDIVLKAAEEAKKKRLKKRLKEIDPDAGPFLEYRMPGVALLALLPRCDAIARMARGYHRAGGKASATAVAASFL